MYNTLKVWSAYETLGSSNLNANFANSDFLKTQVDVTIAHGRLTLETGVAVSSSDQTAKTTLYYTPFNGSKIGLYDGTETSWDLYEFSEVSLSLSGYIKGVLYDIFGYLSGGSLALESLAWKHTTATNNPSAGSSVAINLSDTTGLAVGMEVTVKDGSNSEICTISAVSSGVSITVATLVASYTTPDVYGYNIRATGLTLNGGNWVKSGDATRRYLGTIRITSTAGQCEDSKARRYVFNSRKRVGRDFYAYDTTDSWSYNTVAWRAANGDTTYGTNRVGLVIGLSETLVEVDNLQIVGPSVYPAIGVGINKTDTNSATYGGHIINATGDAIHASYKGMPGIGFYYLQRLETKVAGGSITFYGDYGYPGYYQSAILGVAKM